MYTHLLSDALLIHGGVGNFNKLDVAETIKETVFEHFQGGMDSTLVIVPKNSLLAYLWAAMRGVANDLSKPMVNTTDDLSVYVSILRHYSDAIETITRSEFDVFAIPSTENF